jgi:hypothetical protein
LVARVAAFLGLVWLGVVVVACGGGGGDGAAGGGSAGDGERWEGRFETGSRVTLILWVESNDPAVAEFEAFRQAVGAEPVRYGRVEIRNDSGAADTGRTVTLTDASGDSFGAAATEVNYLCTRIARWIAEVASTTTELVDQYNALLGEHCAGNPLSGPEVPPRDSVTYYVAYEGEAEPDFERVFMGETELER